MCPWVQFRHSAADESLRTGGQFRPRSSHVIPAMIRKFCAAHDRGEREVILWGDGLPTRDFLHVENGTPLVLATTDYDSREPVNIGSGAEMSMAELASRIAQGGLCGHDCPEPAKTQRTTAENSRCVPREPLFGIRGQNRFRRTVAPDDFLVSRVPAGLSGSQS